MFITGARPKNKRSSDRIVLTSIRNEIFMGACQCGYTRDEEKNCDGTHKVVKAVKEDMAAKLAANEFPHASEYVKNN
jgi:CDGSH-type Zn-finger protein